MFTKFQLIHQQCLFLRPYQLRLHHQRYFLAKAIHRPKTNGVLSLVILGRFLDFPGLKCLCFIQLPSIGRDKDCRPNKGKDPSDARLGGMLLPSEKSCRITCSFFLRCGDLVETIMDVFREHRTKRKLYINVLRVID